MHYHRIPHITEKTINVKTISNLSPENTKVDMH